MRKVKIVTGKKENVLRYAKRNGLTLLWEQNGIWHAVTSIDCIPFYATTIEFVGHWSIAIKEQMKARWLNRQFPNNFGNIEQFIKRYCNNG